MVRELKPGMRIWRFRLDRRLARGGMGTVWAAWDERLDREVALKLLPHILVNEPSAARRFEREARAMARLHHPNVVGIHDVGTFDPGVGEDLPYLVMELVRGRSLNELIEEGPLPPRYAARIVEQVALALGAAHEAGVIHRDLKPSNVMVGDGGHVTVLDFGLARLAQMDGETPVESLTSPGMVLGSCPYMAPEQALGKGVTFASDIFSCGTVLYETLAGRRAFDGPTPMQVLQSVVRTEYRPLADVAPETPPEMIAVVERCMAREAKRRYRTANDLARDLSVFQGTDAISLAEAPTMAVSSAKMMAVVKRRRRLVARVGLVAGAALIGGLALGWFGGRRGTEPLRPDPGSWKARTLLETVGILSDPDWHPSNDELVIARNRVGNSDVVIIDTATGAVRSMIAGAPNENLSLPQFSPDGKGLLVEVVTAGESLLRVIPSVGGRPTAEIANAGGGTWIDADSFLFSREGPDGGNSLFSYSMGRRETTREREPESERSWYRGVPRPGGGFALLAGPAGVPDSLFVVDSLRGAPSTWLNRGQEVFGISWAPSGRSLVASVDGRLMQVRAAGASSLIPRLDRLWDPDFSSGGELLAAVRRDATNDLVAVDPDGGGWNCVMCGVQDSGWGSTDRDGLIAYRRYVAGSATVFLREPSGIEEAISEPSEDASCPSISPDGGRVAYLARSGEGGTALRVVARSGGQPVTLAEDVEASEFPSWSPDGRFLAYAAGSPIKVWVVSASGGEPREVTPTGGDYPRWSPDGRWIAYSVWTQKTDPDQGAWVVPAAGGTPIRIGSEPTRLVWSADGEYLWQLRRAGSGLELWQAEPEVWEWSRRAVLDLGRPAGSHLEHLPLTVSPRTGELVFNRRTTLSGLQVFEGLDPDRW